MRSYDSGFISKYILRKQGHHPDDYTKSNRKSWFTQFFSKRTNDESLKESEPFYSSASRRNRSHSYEMNKLDLKEIEENFLRTYIEEFENIAIKDEIHFIHLQALQYLHQDPSYGKTFFLFKFLNDKESCL